MAKEKQQTLHEYLQTAQAKQKVASSRFSKTRDVWTKLAKNPKAAAKAEKWILRAYQRENGKIVGAIDWGKILDWIITNGPMLLQFLLTIISFF